MLRGIGFVFWVGFEVAFLVFVPRYKIVLVYFLHGLLVRDRGDRDQILPSDVVRIELLHLLDLVLDQRSSEAWSLVSLRVSEEEREADARHLLGEKLTFKLR